MCPTYHHIKKASRPFLLPNEESNLAPQNQNLMYYRYTIRQLKLRLSTIRNNVAHMNFRRVLRFPQKLKFFGVPDLNFLESGCKSTAFF